MDKSGIYEISCKHCDKVYVGQTKRSSNVTYKEHLAHLKFKHIEKSSVAQHMLEQCHHVDRIRLVKQVGNSRELDCRESIQIHKRKNRLMNNDINGPLVFSELFDLIK